MVKSGSFSHSGPADGDGGAGGAEAGGAGAGALQKLHERSHRPAYVQLAQNLVSHVKAGDVSKFSQEFGGVS